MSVMLTFSDHIIKKAFVDLEHFLQKVAALDVFEALIFNYKTKIGLPDPLALNFLSVLSEFSNELNLLLKENNKLQNNAEVFTVTDVTDTQNLKEGDNIIKTQGTCQDIPLVFSFGNDEIQDKNLELVEIPIVDDIEPQELPVGCDACDTEKTDVPVCEAEENYIRNATENTSENCTITKVLEEVKLCANDKKNTGTQFIKSSVNENEIKKVCDACGRKFPSSSKLITHLARCPKLKVKSKNDVNGHNCEVCGMTFSSLRLLNDHLAQGHRGAESGQKAGDDSMLYKVVDIQSLPENLPFFCCKNCLFVYKTPADFEAHSCKEVSENTESEGYVGDYFHMLGKYLVSNPDLLARMQKFRCGTCCEEYHSLSRMLYHLGRCTQGPYPCELCGLECTSKRELNGHKKKVHRDTNSFFCDECGLTFKLRPSLQKHKVNRHERRADTTCVECNLTFAKRLQLTNHMIREHQAERKFLCQVCGKKFSTHGSLMAHLTSHSEPFKFSCTFCNKKFHVKEKLIFHIRIHTGERPHLCPTCGKGFIRKSKLDEHMRRHRGEKMYHCSTCDKSYASNWDLKLHMRKQHPDETTPANNQPVATVDTAEEMESTSVSPETDEPAEATAAVSKTSDVVTMGDPAETLKQPECTQFPDLPEDAALAQLAELPLSATEPTVEDTLTHTEGKLVVQLEPSQVPTTLMQAAGEALGTRLLLQLGQNGEASSRILVQLDGGQVAAASGHTALLPPNTILTVADTLQLAPVVEELNLNLGTVSAQYLQLATAHGATGRADSIPNATAGTTTALPLHIQLPVSAVSVPATTNAQTTASSGNPYGLLPLPVQAVFTPASFNVNSLSY